GAAIALVLSLPYARVYLEASRALGPRDVGEITSFSAQWLSYLTTPAHNWLWGWTADRFTGEELRVGPGLVGLALVALGIPTARRSRIALAYVIVCATAVELSLGMNAPLYRWLHAHVSALGGLRAIARFSILAVCAGAVLAGFGVRWLQTRLQSTRQ